MRALPRPVRAHRRRQPMKKLGALDHGGDVGFLRPVPPHLVADRPQRSARRPQRPLPALSPGQQQMLRRRRRAHPLHRLPRSASSRGNSAASLRRQVHGLPLRSRAPRSAASAKANCVTCHMPKLELPGAHQQVHRPRFASSKPNEPYPELTAMKPLTPPACSRSPAAPPRAASSAPPRRPCSKRSRPRTSGITWVHENAMSKEHYLPEALGPGVRLSGLRQRRLDGHLPGQQRPLRFLSTRQSRCATPCTRTIATAPSPTSPRRPESPAAPSAWASRSAITTTTAGPTSSSPPTASCILYHNNRDGTFTDVTEKAGLAQRPAGPPAPSGSTTITTAGSTSSSAASSITATPRTSPAATTSWASTTTASRASSSPPRASSITTTATARSPRSREGTDIAQVARQGPRRGRHGHQ